MTSKFFENKNKITL